MSYRIDEPDYYSGAVCRRGHPITGAIQLRGEPVAQRCTRCGAEVLTACPNPSCGHRIRGSMPGVGSAYRPPDFCDACGTPFPWLSRQGLIFELQNQLDQEDLDPATRLEVKEQLEALQQPDMDEAEQLRRWQRVKRLAPGLWVKDASQKILVTVVSAALKDKLDL